MLADDGACARVRPSVRPFTAAALRVQRSRFTEGAILQVAPVHLQVEGGRERGKDLKDRSLGAGMGRPAAAAGLVHKTSRAVFIGVAKNGLLLLRSAAAAAAQCTFQASHYAFFAGFPVQELAACVSNEPPARHERSHEFLHSTSLLSKDKALFTPQLLVVDRRQCRRLFDHFRPK